jgi:nicotinate-nucleotide--dimethylbenzimidazole phosphoribosyltransferase
MVEGMAMTRAVPSSLEAAVARVEPIDPMWRTRARARLAALTKPLHSLGRLESIAERLCAIQQTISPCVQRRRIVVFAADHGVAEERVSAYPPGVTAQMVANFLRGGAAINALADRARAELWVVDVGVRGPVGIEPGAGGGATFLSRRVREGSRNLACAPAMTAAELDAAIGVGLEAATRAASHGVALLACGEMGIGNTTAASAITAALAGRPAFDVTGYGTGIDEETHRRKVAIVARALEVNAPGTGPVEILRTVGGLEIAAIVGAYIGAAAQRIAIVGDGFIATAAALVAARLCPAFLDYWFAGHLSPEPGHAVQLALLGERPLLDLEMRLGEGTGAALAMGLFDAAAAVMTGMATFDAAGVSGREGV